MSEAALDTADDERLGDVRGYVMRELQRAKDAGAAPADLVAVLTHALGEVLAASGQWDVTPALPFLATQIRDNHARGLQRRATITPALRSRLA